MPHVVVNGPPLKDLDRKRTLAKEITNAVSKVYNLPPAAITVVIREDEPTNVASAGVLLSDR